MTVKGFGAGLEYMPTLEDFEKIWLDVWECINPSQRKNYEADLEARNAEAFEHFRDNVLVNHPEYQP